MAAILIASLGGCATGFGRPNAVSQVTLLDALKQVRQGIYELQGSQLECLANASASVFKKEYASLSVAEMMVVDSRCEKVGLMVKEVEVNFNITALAKEQRSDEASLDLTNIFVEVPSAGFKRSSEDSEQRGNTIKFKFENALLVGKDTLLGLDLQHRIKMVEAAADSSERGNKQESAPALAPATSPLKDLFDDVEGPMIMNLDKEDLKKATRGLGEDDRSNDSL